MSWIWPWPWSWAASFGRIVDSLVTDIIMPLAGLILGGVDFSALSLKLRGKACLTYGNFLQTLLDFLIITGAIFPVVRLLNRFRAKEEKGAAADASLDKS